jgi:hypothetical protein
LIHDPTLRHLKNKYKSLILIVLILAVLIITASLRRIPQDLAYHQFADGRTFFGIPNFWNVISNLPFLIIGIYGIWFLAEKKNREIFTHWNNRLIWICIFAGIACVGLGSAYYHVCPSNDRLVWDRLPMTLVFMSLAALIISERIQAKAGLVFLILLNALGVFSVWYWQYTEQQNQGDLRLYAFVQFAPMFILPAILLLYRKGPALFPDLAWVFLFYVLAKLTEHFDAVIYRFCGFWSGHTIKHFAASLAVFYLFRIVVRRRNIHLLCEHP